MTTTIAFRRLSFMLFLAGGIVMAQPQDRLRSRLEGHGTVPLRGTRNPRLVSAEDVGPLADDHRIHGIQLHFKPSAAQSTALTR
jgi:hypothetical protein